jgi:hypothetical protein
MGDLQDIWRKLSLPKNKRDTAADTLALEA